MAYLIPKDFNKSIKADLLSSIATASMITDAENLAYEVAVSNLVQKYEIKAELSDTAKHDPAVSYKAGQRVYLDYPVYVPATAYVAGNVCLYAGNNYACISGTTGTFDQAAWSLIGAQYAMYTAVLPKPLFQVTRFYNRGDQVFWKDNVYTCQISTVATSHESAIQYGTINKLPLQNIFPDDVYSGPQYWGAPTAYSVPGNTAITNTAAWSVGDGRSQQLVNALVDIVLRTLHKSIAPRNIPDLREKAYDEALAWFKKASTGAVTAQLPEIQPQQGIRIRSGGNVKNQNWY